MIAELDALISKFERGGQALREVRDLFDPSAIDRPTSDQIAQLIAPGSVSPLQLPAAADPAGDDESQRETYYAALERFQAWAEARGEPFQVAFRKALAAYMGEGATAPPPTYKRRGRPPKARPAAQADAGDGQERAPASPTSTSTLKPRRAPKLPAYREQGGERTRRGTPEYKAKLSATIKAAFARKRAAAAGESHGGNGSTAPAPPAARASTVGGGSGQGGGRGIPGLRSILARSDRRKGTHPATEAAQDLED